MGYYFTQDQDAFDPDVVRKADEDRRRRAADVTRDGRGGYCGHCNAVVGATAMPGCVCPKCGRNMKSVHRY